MTKRGKLSSGCASVGRIVALYSKVCSSNQVISKILHRNFITVDYLKDKNIEKEARNG